MRGSPACSDICIAWSTFWIPEQSEHVGETIVGPTETLLAELAQVEVSHLALLPCTA